MDIRNQQPALTNSGVSQQTSSSMEEIANNAEELAILAEQLNGQVRKFKL